MLGVVLIRSRLVFLQILRMPRSERKLRRPVQNLAVVVVVVSRTRVVLQAGLLHPRPHRDPLAADLRLYLICSCAWRFLIRPLLVSGLEGKLGSPFGCADEVRAVVGRTRALVVQPNLLVP